MVLLEIICFRTRCVQFALCNYEYWFPISRQKCCVRCNFTMFDRFEDSECAKSSVYVLLKQQKEREKDVFSL